MDWIYNLNTKFKLFAHVHIICCTDTLYTYLLMDVIGQGTQLVVQSQHPGHSWHAFGGLVWLYISG